MNTFNGEIEGKLVAFVNDIHKHGIQSDTVASERFYELIKAILNTNASAYNEISKIIEIDTNGTHRSLAATLLVAFACQYVDITTLLNISYQFSDNT